MRLIPLSGKYATGHFTHARVDDQDYAYLNQWRWKAKPNGAGTHIYARRTEYVDGKSRNVWMHREVLGLGRDDPHDTDHRDHDTVNNTRANLRKATRSQNVKHQRMVLASGVCTVCDADFYLFVKAGTAAHRIYCSLSCADMAKTVRAAALYQPKLITETKCWACEQSFMPLVSGQQYCSKVCNDKGSRPPFSKVYFKRCQQCDKHHVSRRVDSKFCSRQCARRFRYENSGSFHASL